MRNWIFFSMICSILIFAGCSPAENNAQSNLPASLSPAVGEQQLVTDTATDILLVQLPTDVRFTETHDRFIEDFVRSKITAYVGEELDLTRAERGDGYTGQAYSRYYIKINSTISYISDDLVSLIFTGFLNDKNAAHPSRLFFTCNFDPNLLREIRFSERFSIDDALYEAFSAQGEKNILDESGGNWPDGWKSFSEQLCSKDQFFTYLKNEGSPHSSFCCYYTERGVGFSYSVPYALGDHKEVILPYYLLNAKSP